MAHHSHVARALVVVCALLAGCASGPQEQYGFEVPRSSETVTPPPLPTAKPAPDVFVQDFDGVRMDGEPAQVRVDDSSTGEVLANSTVGLSFESEDLTDVRWDPDRGNLDEVLATLNSPGLRFGGNSLDRRVFWTSSGEMAPDNTHTTITPADLTRVGKMAKKLGSDVTLGVPLGDFDPERGADMVEHAQAAFGDRLVGISIGNEPNGFTTDTRPGLRIRDDSWNEATYVDQVRQYVDAIQTRTGGTTPIIGPAAYDGPWMSAFLEAEFPGTTALTQHWYATYDCGSTEIPGRGPEPENLVDPVVHEGFESMASIGSNYAEAADLPLWLEETGSTSCVGETPSSRTHATALWTVDHIFHAGALGIDRVNMHSMLGPCDTGTAMSVVCSSGGRTRGSGAWGGSGTVRGQVNFPSMQLASLSTGGEMVAVDLSGGSNMRSYAVRKNDKYLVTVLNNNPAAKGGSRVTVAVPDGYRATTAAQVHAPDIDARNATELTPLIKLGGRESGVVSSKSGELAFDLVPASATTLVFEERA